MAANRKNIVCMSLRAQRSNPVVKTFSAGLLCRFVPRNDIFRRPGVDGFLAFLKILLFTILLLSFSIILPQFTYAEGEEEEYVQDNYLPLVAPHDSTESDSKVPQPQGNNGIDKAIVLAENIFNNIRILLATVAFGMFCLSGFYLITAQGNEEVITKQKTNMMWWGIGLAVILLVKPMLQVLNVADGGIFGNEEDLIDRVKLFDESTTIVITYIKYIIWAVAVLYIVRSAYMIIAFGDEEDTITKEKKNILYSTLALIMITVADVYVNKFLFVVDKGGDGFTFDTTSGVDPGVNARQGLTEIAGFTNFVVTLAGPLAILFLIVGAVMYVTAAGDDDQMNRAKGIVRNTIIALIIIYGAFGLVTTFIAGSIEGTDASL